MSPRGRFKLGTLSTRLKLMTSTCCNCSLNKPIAVMLSVNKLAPPASGVALMMAIAASKSGTRINITAIRVGASVSNAISGNTWSSKLMPMYQPLSGKSPWLPSTTKSAPAPTASCKKSLQRILLCSVGKTIAGKLAKCFCHFCCNTSAVASPSTIQIGTLKRKASLDTYCSQTLSTSMPSSTTM